MPFASTCAKAMEPRRNRLCASTWVAVILCLVTSLSFLGILVAFFYRLFWLYAIVETPQSGVSRRGLPRGDFSLPFLFLTLLKQSLVPTYHFFPKMSSKTQQPVT